jgi:hypothetical protein
MCDNSDVERDDPVKVTDSCRLDYLELRGLTRIVTVAFARDSIRAPVNGILLGFTCPQAPAH